MKGINGVLESPTKNVQDSEWSSDLSSFGLERYDPSAVLVLYRP